MFTRILIPLDGSSLAERAIPHAEQFARIFGANIVLLRVLEVTSHQENPDPINPLSWQIRKAEADIYLSGIAAQIREHLSGSNNQVGDAIPSENRVEYAIREGRTAENIIDFAHKENIDLLIISSHGWGGLSRWNMSSIIQKVIDQIYLPLLIVRSYESQGESSEKIQYRNILLPIDSSRRAEIALAAGILLAQGSARIAGAPREDLPGTDSLTPELPRPGGESTTSKLFLAAVIAPPEIPIPAPYPLEITQLFDQLLRVSREAVLAYMSEIKHRLPVESEIRVVESNQVASVIQDLANRDQIDLILMSAHGNSGQFTHPYGNVTRNCIEDGTKSILVIQDMPRSQVQPTASAVAAEKSGSR